MDKNKEKLKSRIRRKQRGRKKINGTASRPRLCVYRSNKNWYAQVIDDDKATTLVAASTIEEGLKTTIDNKSNAEAAAKVGTLVAERCLEKGISEIVFDKNGFLYHGRIKMLADAAREAGLKF